MAIARWFVLVAQMSEKVPDLQVSRCGDGGLTPVCCGRAVQTSEQTFAGPGHREISDITVTEIEAIVEPDRIGSYVGWESVAFIDSHQPIHGSLFGST